MDLIIFDNYLLKLALKELFIHIIDVNCLIKLVFKELIIKFIFEVDLVKVSIRLIKNIISFFSFLEIIKRFLFDF